MIYSDHIIIQTRIDNFCIIPIPLTWVAPLWLCIGGRACEKLSLHMTLCTLLLSFVQTGLYTVHCFSLCDKRTETFLFFVPMLGLLLVAALPKVNFNVKQVSSKTIICRVCSIVSTPVYFLYVWKIWTQEIKCWQNDLIVILDGCVKSGSTEWSKVFTWCRQHS